MKQMGLEQSLRTVSCLFLSDSPSPLGTFSFPPPNSLSPAHTHLYYGAWRLLSHFYQCAKWLKILSCLALLPVIHVVWMSIFYITIFKNMRLIAWVYCEYVWEVHTIGLAVDAAGPDPITGCSGVAWGDLCGHHLPMPWQQPANHPTVSCTLQRLFTVRRWLPISLIWT